MIALFLSCAFATGLLAQESPAPYALEQIIAHALEHNMDIAAARWKVAAADAQLRKAESARFLPRLRIDSESGLVPEAKGDVFNPPSDTSGVRPLGPFNRTELEFIQPIYPISRGRQLKAAAENGVSVEQADLADARVTAEYEIKKLYHGVLLAQDLNALVRRLTDELNERQDELAQSDALPMSSRYKLDLALLELDKQGRQVAMQLSMSQRALAWRAGLADSTALSLRARWLAPVQTEIPALEDLVDQSLAQRPDWRKIGRAHV